MTSSRKSKPTYYSDEDHDILRNLFSQFGDPNKARRFKYWEDVCEEFNSRTKSAKRNPIQIRAYFRFRKQKCAAYPFKTEADPDYLNCNGSPPNVDATLESLSSPAKKPKTLSISSGAFPGSSSDSKDDFRSLADDLPKSWEYTEIGASEFLSRINAFQNSSLTGFLGSTNTESTSSLKLSIVDRDEPHIFDDIDDLSSGRSTVAASGMSSDLVNILAEQARQHHKLKIKLVKEKFRRVSEVYKMKMFILENELEMKRKEHEKKMDILMQKYRKVKDGLQE